MSGANSTAGEDDIVVLVHPLNSLDDLISVIGDHLSPLELDPEVEQERSQEPAVRVLRL